MMKKLVSAPYLLWMAIFIIVPLIMVAYFALTDTNGAFTLDNLAAVSQYSNIFIRSIWLAAVATVICLIIAYPLALILANTDKSYQSTVLMIVMHPNVDELSFENVRMDDTFWAITDLLQAFLGFSALARLKC